jgi:catechol 2,3-dioxygenase-like lactoylglutathione lyase family enzyme
MIDHLGIPVHDYEKSKRFYLAALKPLGIGLVMEAGEGRERAAGLGANGKPFFWFAQEPVGSRLHLCFTARTRAEVDAFHEARRCRPGRRTTVRRACARTITRTTTAPS